MILYFEYNVKLKTYSNFKIKDEIPLGKNVVHTEWSDIIGLDNILMVWVNNHIWIPNKEFNQPIDAAGFKIINNGVILINRFLKLKRILK